MAVNTTGSHSYTSGKYGLMLEDLFVGWISSVEGGGVSANVVEGMMGPDYLTKKHLGAISSAGIKLEFKNSIASPPFWSWLGQAVSGRPTLRNGAILTCDYNYLDKWQMTWVGGRIAEVTFPKLDSSSKNSVPVGITIMPRETRRATGSGKVHHAAPGRPFHASDFKLNIDGMECGAVEGIDAIQIKGGGADSVGSFREGSTGLGAGVSSSGLSLTVPEAHATIFYKWKEQPVTKNGSLEYFSSFALMLQGLKVVHITADKVSSAAADRPGHRGVSVRLSYTGLSFKPGPA